jgi:predicted transcriptional regulator
MEEFKRMSKQMEELSRATIIDPFSDDFFEVFTKKRMELIRTIMDEQPTSIRDLAQTVERDIKNVFDDLKLLHNFNIIDFEPQGRCKKPLVKSKTIIFKFSNGGQL